MRRAIASVSSLSPGAAHRRLIASLPGCVNRVRRGLRLIDENESYTSGGKSLSERCDRSADKVRKSVVSRIGDTISRDRIDTGRGSISASQSAVQRRFFLGAI